MIHSHACEQSPQRKPQMIWCLLILHNMLVERDPELQLELESDDFRGEDGDIFAEIYEDSDPYEQGHRRRDQLVRSLWDQR